ncbi:putative RING-containing E3 ubiquitin ligase, partial [Pseudoloma neurophilia]
DNLNDSKPFIKDEQIIKKNIKDEQIIKNEQIIKKNIKKDSSIKNEQIIKKNIKKDSSIKNEKILKDSNHNNYNNEYESIPNKNIFQSNSLLKTKYQKFKNIFYFLFLKITKKLNLFKNIKIENLYIQYSNIFYYSHIIVIITLISLLISLLFDSFILLNIGLIIFFYINYFLILIQEIIIGSNTKFENQVINSEKDCGVCGYKILSSEKKDTFLKGNNKNYQENYENKNYEEKNTFIKNFINSIKLNLKRNKKNSIYTLPCGHKFHINCIRGYYLLTCSEICPICSEKYKLENILDSLLKGLFFFNIFMNIIRQAILYTVIGGIILLLVKIRNGESVQHTRI